MTFRNITILALIIIGLLSAFGQSKTAAKKRDIVVDSVDQIVIIRRAVPPYTIYNTKILTAEQIKLFVKQWNGSQNKTLCKYLPLYNFTVYFKDGSTREFRAILNRIKEGNDECYDFDAGNFTRGIWTSE